MEKRIVRSKNPYFPIWITYILCLNSQQASGIQQVTIFCRAKFVRKIDRVDATVVILYHQQMLQVAGVVCFFIVRGKKGCTFCLDLSSCVQLR
jgi:hypothetical protein